MKILYLINHAGKAGTEKYVLNLVDAFNSREVKCYFAYNEPGLLSEQMAQRKISTFQFEMKTPYDLKAAKTLARICRENKIDIIHAQYPRENYIAVLSHLYYKKTKIVFTSHLTLENNALWKITNRIMTPHDDKIIAVCNHGKELLIGNGCPKDKIQVIFNGVVPDDSTERSSTIREELGIDKDTFVIALLARFYYTKGLDFFVDSVKKLDSKMKRKYIVLIAGDGELFEQINDKIKSLGLEDKIKCLGYRTDTQNILYGADIFVNSSMCHEALSFAILEGLNAGLPAVVTNIGGNGDIVNENTSCGKIVEYGDTDAMADAIFTLSEDKELYKQCKAGAAKAIREVFSLDKVLGETFDVYREITQ